MKSGPATAAVIGANGFIGSRLIDTLSAAGVAVAPISRATPFVHEGRVSPELRGARVVFHLATSVNPALADRYPERVAADQSAFTGLLEALRATGHRPALVLTSSAGAIYDPDVPPPYGEGDPVRPSTAYGRAKLGLERSLFAARDAVHPIVLRLANVYGPGQRTGTGQGVIGHWLEAVAAGEPLRLYGDEATLRDYVHLDDVAGALLRAYRLALDPPGAADPLVFNIGSGRPVSLAGLRRIVCETVGHDLPFEHAPGRRFDRRDVWFDVTRAAGALGWSPRTGLEEGIRRTWRALRRPAA